jgi:DNA-binding transcriptional LysR family regulator
MDIRDLEVFLAVAKHMNFTRAGEEVHLSQPSISVRIRRLEEELGVKLFEQANKKTLLLEPGRLLVPYANRAVRSLDGARQAIEEFRGLERGALKLGASTTPGMYLVPKIVSKFKRQYPKIAVRLSIQNTRQVETDVLGNEFDLGFVGGHLIGEEIEQVPWHTDKIVAVVARRHPLSRKGKIKLSNLAEEQFIFREPGSATRATVEKCLEALKIRIEPATEMGNPEAVKQAAIDGFGIAFLSEFAVIEELKSKKLVALNVQGLDIHRELKIIYRKGKHLSRAAQAFIEEAKYL